MTFQPRNERTDASVLVDVGLASNEADWLHAVEADASPAIPTSADVLLAPGARPTFPFLADFANVDYVSVRAACALNAKGC